MNPVTIPNALAAGTNDIPGNLFFASDGTRPRGAY